MDEQFSQAYKDFMLSDEAKGLQKHLDIRFGTAILAPVMGHDVIVFVTEVEHDPSAACDFYAIFEGSGTPNAFLREDVTVLPSLRDLLRIIEGAGWDWKAERYHTRVSSQARYWVYAQNHALELYEDEICIDVMLAAAKVAARAVEGK